MNFITLYNQIIGSLNYHGNIIGLKDKIYMPLFLIFLIII